MEAGWRRSGRRWRLELDPSLQWRRRSARVKGARGEGKESAGEWSGDGMVSGFKRRARPVGAEATAAIRGRGHRPVLAGRVVAAGPDTVACRVGGPHRSVTVGKGK